MASLEDDERFEFVRCDIADAAAVQDATRDAAVEAIFHFAAESHVDRSITGAGEFVRTNVLGTQNLLDVCRTLGCRRFVHVSTDEVYGALGIDEKRWFVETDALEPTSPYAASKAAAGNRRAPRT